MATTLTPKAEKRLARLSWLTGRPPAALLEEMLDDRLAAAEMEALRGAVRVGIDQADRGEFTTRTVAEIFAAGIAAAKAKPNPPL